MSASADEDLAEAAGRQAMAHVGHGKADRNGSDTSDIEKA